MDEGRDGCQGRVNGLDNAEQLGDLKAFSLLLAERAEPRESDFKRKGGILLLIKVMELITKDKPIASQN